MIDEKHLLERFGPSADIENALYVSVERHWPVLGTGAAFAAELRDCKARLARDWIQALRPDGLLARLWFGFRLALWSFTFRGR